MKTTLTIILLAATANAGTLDVIREVETRPGTEARRVNPYQIERIWWEDACRIGKVDWPYAWRNRPERVDYLAECWWRHYDLWTFEERVRSWNGGPRYGSETDEYYRLCLGVKGSE